MLVFSVVGFVVSICDEDVDARARVTAWIGVDEVDYDCILMMNTPVN